MPSPLLITKLHIPQARTTRVLRPHLVTRLQQGLACPLTLISAPPGFGKTTLLCEWLESCKQPAAWVSLDKGDNDPARFWSYVVAALQNVCPAAGQSLPDLLTAPDLPPVETFLSDLINNLAEQPHPVIVVLDDYHIIETQAIHEGLLFLIEHASPYLHITISSRADPPWPLARLRACEQLVEVRVADLRFTFTEAAEFLRHAVQLDLTPDEISALEERTEGWIAGLQMVALSLQDRKDVHQFITAFTGSNHFIFDYLVEEVLQRQPAEIYEFLLKTSVLERLSAGLCNAVLDKNNSQDTLTELDRDNLFIIPLDDERCWYRYHHLFTSLLRSRLEQTWKDIVPELNRKASTWCGRAGLIEEAVLYAQASANQPFILELLETHILATIALGEFSLARCWLASLSEEAIRSNAILCIAKGWTVSATNEVSLKQAEQWMESARTAQGWWDSAPANLQSDAACNLAAFGVMQARDRGKPVNEVIQLCLEALDFVAYQNPQIRSMLLMYLGESYQKTGELEAANRSFEEAGRIGTASQNYNAAFASINTRLVDAYMRAQFTEALRIGQEGIATVLHSMEQTGRIPPDSAFTYAVLGMIMLERNNLFNAQEYLSKALDLFPKVQQPSAQAWCSLAFARAKRAMGDMDSIPDPSSLISDHFPEMDELFASIRARIRLLKAGQDTNQFARAIRWADQLEAGAGEQVVTRAEILALAQVRVAQFRLDKTHFPQSRLQTIQDLLTEKLENAREYGLVLNIIEIQIQRAQLLGSTEQLPEAIAALGEALRLAEPEGIVRLFLDESEPLPSLLADLKISIERAAHTPSDKPNNLLRFIDRLLSDKPRVLPQMRSSIPDPDHLIQPLSGRELEILSFLNTSLTSTEIAARLYISVGTVRTHIKNIYAKLNVSRRMEAIQRAAELELIESH